MARWLQISLLAPLVALALAGCGSGDDGTIPEGDGNELLALLDALQSDVEAGDCETIDDRAAQVQTQVQALPAEVDSAVKTELLDAAAQLENLSADPPECVDSGATGGSGVEPVEEAEEEPAAETPAEEPEVPEEPAPTEAETDSPSQGNGPPTDTPGNSDPGGDEAPSESGGVSGEFDN